MNNIMKLCILLLVSLFLIMGCSAEAVVTPTTSKPSSNPTTSPATMPATMTPAAKPSSKDIKVDVIYFHRVQRCVTCLCFEERINYVVNTYFNDEIKDRRMTYRVLSLGDSKNKDIALKYGAVGSQLFINTIIGDKENIRDIQDIWNWGCRKNKQAFDNQVKNVIEQSLEGNL